MTFMASMNVRRTNRPVKLPSAILVSLVVALCIPLFASDRALFQLKVGNLVYPFEMGSVFMLPGEKVKLEMLGANGSTDFEVKVPSGTVKRLSTKEWEWESPVEIGKHHVDIS